ncbi:hypothetical protein QUA00_30980 [Microcoleus sp. T2B6]|uniref:hypothetical protein n=1 Tax=unclassified Microcoleus TaxID=2642155 RepID=UPI002FD2E7D6
MSFLASQAVQPVHKRLIENGATSQMKLLWGVGVGRPARPKNTTQDARQLIKKSLRKKNCRLSEVETGFLTTNFKGGTRHVIYPWNQSKIENRKSSRKSIYPWGRL